MADYATSTIVQMLPIALVVFTTWVIGLYTYRLTLHPLAKFPGPKLAAVSRWYEFYYDVVLKGQYVFHLPELHKQYGPIIRISPEELHIDDPGFYDTFYARSGRLHKYARDGARFGNPASVFVTADASVHRLRRTVLNPYFAKCNADAFQPVVQAKVKQMLDKIAAYQGTEKPVTLSLGYMAFTGDVIMEYCFGYNYNHLESEGFSTNFHETLATATQSSAVAAHFPIVMTILMSMPEWFVVWSTPLFALLFKLRKSAERDVKRFRAEEKSGDKVSQLTKPNVVQYLMRSDLPMEERTDERISDEAQNFIGAGVSTTGWALSVASFHIINNRAIYERLHSDLKKLIPDPSAASAVELTKLEKCDYLTACIKEGIRLAYAISGRSIRVSDNVIHYGRWQIPPGTPVGMTMVDVSHNEDIFPDSWTYNPDRWLGEAKTKTGEPVEKYWVGFGKGTRSCLGINLAWLELYMALAGVFRTFDFELFHTDESDVVIKHDFMTPCPKLDSKGIRVLVKA